MIFCLYVFYYIFCSISSLELKSKKVEDVLIKAKKQIIVGINTESKNKSMIKRLKKQLYVITWVCTIFDILLYYMSLI